MFWELAYVYNKPKGEDFLPGDNNNTKPDSSALWAVNLSCLCMCQDILQKNMLHYSCKLKTLDSCGADSDFQGVTPLYSQITLGRNVLWEVDPDAVYFKNWMCMARATK